jgi:class 3 adenylate cyclase
VARNDRAGRHHHFALVCRTVLVLLVTTFAFAAAAADVSTLDPPTSLAGGWQCFAKDGSLGDAPLGDDVRWHDVTLPQDDGSALCDMPSVWLRRTVRVVDALRTAPLGVSLGEVRGAYEVFVDGERIGSADEIRRGKAFAIPARALDDGSVDVLVHVVRDAAALGTILDKRVVVNGPLALGGMPSLDGHARDTVELRVLREASASLAMAALFLFIGLYHVLVWLLRRDLTGYLWFGIFASTANAWITFVSVVGTPLLPLDARTGLIWGNFLGSLVNAAFIEFSFRYLTKGPPTKPWRIYVYVLVAIAFFGFIPVVGVTWTVSPPVVLAKLAMPIACLVLFIRGARKGSREAKVLLVGLAIAALGAPLQYLVLSRGLHMWVSPGQIALAVFFLSMAVALAAQFARTLDDVDARARELAETNTSILRFVPLPFLNALGKKSVLEVKRGEALSTSMSVMFCDLRGFTTIAERMGHEETFALINRYLERMEPPIHAAGGFINQYLGDGIMALFPKGADAAVQAAAGMARALEQLNAERATKGEPELKIGIGIHTGQLMLGTIGGGERLDKGVIGDVVNTAARLEGITKMYGARVLLSGETMSALSSPEKWNLRPLDAVKAKGKTEPLALVELLDADVKLVRDVKVKTRGELEAALALYRKGAFQDAAVRFGALAAAHPEDGAARALHDRCNELLASPPDAWSGILSLATK